MPSNATRGVGIYNQRSYFKAAVAMRRDYDPIKSWVANEITPSNKTLYLVGGYCSMVTKLLYILHVPVNMPTHFVASVLHK
jgi:hypothetical protein